MRPTNREIDRVMHETGMDRMQAYRHLQSRELARATETERRRKPRDRPID